MERTRIITGLACLFALASGCASVQTDQEWGALEQRVVDRTGKAPVWEKSPEEAGRVRQEVDTLLVDGLTREEAVRIALMNNRTLQSRFEEIGVSKSDMVQAGLFQNPSLSAIFRFPTHGSGTQSEIEGGLALSDLWQIPLRKKVAAKKLEKTMLQVEAAVLDTIRDAKQAYDSVLFARLAEKEAEALRKQFAEIAAEVRRRRNFGFLKDPDVYGAEAMEVEAEIVVHGAASDVRSARAHLDRMLGLKPDRTAYDLAPQVESGIPELPDEAEVIRFALENRLSIQVARLRVSGAGRRLVLQKARVLKEVHAGGSFEREVEGDEFFGPAVDIEIPLFDQNQAQIAKARYRVRQARKLLQAEEGQVREEIIGDLSQIHYLKKRVRLLQDRMIPLRKKALEYARRWVGAMQLNRLYLLEAQKAVLESQLEWVEARMRLRRAVVSLERHLGGKWPEAK
jgi:outer membrane protein TolC